METMNNYEKYPIRTVILSNLVSLGIYGCGFFIMSRLGWVFAFLYLFYILIFEYRLIRKHCINCFYWGRTCGFGKGIISSWFFKQGDTSKFCNKKFTWWDMIPDILVTAIPLLIGIILLIIEFDFALLSAMFLLIILTTLGNGFVRGTLVCKYCKQQESGCPAYLLFNKEKDSMQQT